MRLTTAVFGFSEATQCIIYIDHGDVKRYSTRVSGVPLDKLGKCHSPETQTTSEGPPFSSLIVKFTAMPSALAATVHPSLNSFVLVPSYSLA
jgi:hypothetical protein